MEQIEKTCTGCKKGILGWADFCPYFGKAVAQGTEAASPEFWEYCEIEQNSLSHPDAIIGWYQARAVTKWRNFLAAESERFIVLASGEVVGDADGVFQQLITELVGRGWQPMPNPGRFGRFRRRAV